MNPLQIKEAIREDEIIINPESINEAQRKSKFRRRRAKLIIEAQQQKNQEILEEKSSHFNIEFKL